MFATNRRQAEMALKNLGISQSWRVRYGPLLFVLLVVVAAVVGLWAVEKYHPWGNDINGTNALTAVVGLGAFLIGYNQWRSAKQETSLERYYERLKIANEARNSLTDADHPDPMHMYAFTELDNLEYVLQKYQLGYMAAEHALRGVKTFNSRLTGVRRFDDAVNSLGDVVNHGYQQGTWDLLQRLRSAGAKSIL
ncbi:MAG: hypothetical protein JO307_28550 [Bryobacterales bacterium]|nr:hypothetical protein [Bryobacterales bacterium]